MSITQDLTDAQFTCLPTGLALLDTVNPEFCFFFFLLAASCSDGSLTKTISCSDSAAGSSFASLRTQYPIVDKGIPFSAHHCLHVFPLAWHCWIRSDQSFEYSCAVTPQVRQTGNRLSGLAGTAYASLLT